MPSETRRTRTRHVFAAVTVAGVSCERPGVILEWSQDDRNAWWARTAYVATDDGMLVVDWIDARKLTPVPIPDGLLR